MIKKILPNLAILLSLFATAQGYAADFNEATSVLPAQISIQNARVTTASGTKHATIRGCKSFRVNRNYKTSESRSP